MNNTLIEKNGKLLPYGNIDYLYNKNYTLFIIGDITDESANKFIIDLIALKNRINDEENKKITIYINSPGGSVNAGLSMLDVINETKKHIPVEIICFNMVASMASVIASSGTSRKAYKNTKILIHEMLVSELPPINVSGISNLSEQLKQHNEYVADILAKNTKNSLSKVLKKLKENIFMTSEEAKEFGIIDEII